jgi:hypothetical protein
MSGSNYTQTPNLGLFKPIFNSDVGNWGSHWNSNADTLDSALATGTGGLFLPIAGGTVTGNLTVSGTTALTTLGSIGTWNAGKVVMPGIVQFEQNSSASGNIFFNIIPQYGTAWPNPTSQFLSQLNLAQATAPSSDVIAAEGIATVYGAFPGNAVGVAGLATFQGTGAGNGVAQQIALIGYGTRNVAITNPTTTVTATLSAPATSVQVANIGLFKVLVPVLINGHNYMVTGVSGTSGAGTLTVNTPISVADGTTGNTVTANNNPQIFGANIYAADNTGLPSAQTNWTIGMELDLTCNGADNAGSTLYGVPQGVRTILNLVGGLANSGGAAGEIGDACAISTSGGSNLTFKRGFSIADRTQFSQAGLDMRAGIEMAGANTIWLATGQHIALDTAGTAGAANLRLSSNGTNATLAGGGLILPLLTNAANDAAAASAGVVVGQMYRNGSIVMQRVA